MPRPGKAGDRRASGPAAGTDGRYKWVALANRTAAVFMSALPTKLPKPHRRHLSKTEPPATRQGLFLCLQSIGMIK